MKFAFRRLFTPKPSFVCRLRRGTYVQQIRLAMPSHLEATPVLPYDCINSMTRILVASFYIVLQFLSSRLIIGLCNSFNNFAIHVSDTLNRIRHHHLE